ncbi:MAG TPA: SDR family NAD(P)-dependent oxidoreductase, partial [Actinomycetota bacterium]|nr:SDR family NAD(P)-dependent oxidoreductase [Actinomycetota bacterium]
MDLGLAGAAAVVQGGTQGMGRAAAACLATDGARVAVVARTQADLDATTEQLLELGAAEAV